MKKNVILIFIFIFNINLFGITDSDFFIKSEKFKSTEFYYPVLIVNSEIGQRFAYQPLDDLLENDYQTIDAYNLNNGYLKISQQLTKFAKIRLKYLFSKKDYESSKELNNRSWTYNLSVLYKFLPDLTADVWLSYKEKLFNNNNAKNNFTTSPGAEIKFKPKKGVLLGLKYVYGNNHFQTISNDSKNNRILIYWQESFYNSKLKFRVRYRGENKNYAYPDLVHKNSTKHTISATAKIDFN